MRAVAGRGAAGAGAGGGGALGGLSGGSVPGWLGLVRLTAMDDEAAAELAALLRGLFRAQEEHRWVGTCSMHGWGVHD